jgi:hypothetical protein
MTMIIGPAGQPKEQKYIAQIPLNFYNIVPYLYKIGNVDIRYADLDPLQMKTLMASKSSKRSDQCGDQGDNVDNSQYRESNKPQIRSHWAPSNSF